MLFAQAQNDVEGAIFLGAMIAACISGAIPFVTGLAMRQTGLGIAGGVVSGAAGVFAGCCGGIPVAIICTMVIVWVAQTAAARSAPSPFDAPLAEDYDDYARAFQLPGREPDRRRDGDRRRDDRSDGVRQARRRDPEPDDRRRGADDDLRRRAEEEEKYRQRGFRPRKRDADWDD